MSTITVVGSSTRPQNIWFDIKSSTIRRAAFPDLDSIVKVFNNFLSLSLSLELDGHTDSFECSVTDTLLSFQRAFSVKEYLVEKGLSKDRIWLRGYGCSKALCLQSGNQDDDHNQECRQLSRRVEFRVVGSIYANWQRLLSQPYKIFVPDKFYFETDSSYRLTDYAKDDLIRFNNFMLANDSVVIEIALQGKDLQKHIVVRRRVFEIESYLLSIDSNIANRIHVRIGSGGGCDICPPNKPKPLIPEHTISFSLIGIIPKGNN